MLDNAAGAVDFRVAVWRAQLNRKISNLQRKIAARLPHRLVCWVLANVAAVTIRRDEVIPEIPFMELFGRWERRELHGCAAARHPARPRRGD